MNNHNAYYLNFDEPVRSCLLALKDLILETDPNLSPAWKYRMPFFCYSGKMCCYLWTDKTTGEPYIGFVEGNRMQHPELETGDRTRMKILSIDTGRDLPVDLIRELLNEALGFYRKGIIPLRKQSRNNR